MSLPDNACRLSIEPQASNRGVRKLGDKSQTQPEVVEMMAEKRWEKNLFGFRDLAFQ